MAFIDACQSSLLLCAIGKCGGRLSRISVLIMHFVDCAQARIVVFSSNGGIMGLLFDALTLGMISPESRPLVLLPVTRVKYDCNLVRFSVIIAQSTVRCIFVKSFENHLLVNI